MTCPCGGWGVQDVEIYRVGPCPECREKISRDLRALYDVDEDIPDDMRALLTKLK